MGGPDVSSARSSRVPWRVQALRWMWSRCSWVISTRWTSPTLSRSKNAARSADLHAVCRQKNHHQTASWLGPGGRVTPASSSPGSFPLGTLRGTLRLRSPAASEQGEGKIHNDCTGFCLVGLAGFEPATS